MKPDFKKAYRIATENVLLASSTIASFPVDIASFIREETDLKLYTYETAVKKWHLDMPQFGSEDAFLSEMNGRFILFYNSNVCESRVRWSIAHELGHFLLGHALNSEKLNEDEYGIQEVEAHFFAAQVMMPDQIIRELAVRGERVLASSLRKWFQVSKEAADKRIETVNHQSGLEICKTDNDYSQEVIFKFASSIEAIRPKHATGSLYNDVDDDERQAERDSWMYEW